MKETDALRRRSAGGQHYRRDDANVATAAGESRVPVRADRPGDTTRRSAMRTGSDREHYSLYCRRLLATNITDPALVPRSRINETDVSGRGISLLNNDWSGEVVDGHEPNSRRPVMIRRGSSAGADG